jgi:hypothetical protein
VGLRAYGGLVRLDADRQAKADAAWVLCVPVAEHGSCAWRFLGPLGTKITLPRLTTKQRGEPPHEVGPLLLITEGSRSTVRERQQHCTARC